MVFMFCAEACTLMKYSPAAGIGMGSCASAFAEPSPHLERRVRIRRPQHTHVIAALPTVHVPWMHAARGGVGNLHVGLHLRGVLRVGRHPSRAVLLNGAGEPGRGGEHGVPLIGDRLCLGIYVNGVATAPDKPGGSDDQTCGDDSTHAILHDEKQISFPRLYGGRRRALP